MNKQEAIAAVEKMAAYHKDVKTFYVTTDEVVHIKDALAVAHAVTLSPGNPEVCEVERHECAITELPQEQQQEEEDNTEAIEEIELEVMNLKAEIKERDNDAEVSLDNTAEKMHVASLKERLEQAETELASLTTK